MESIPTTSRSHKARNARFSFSTFSVLFLYKSALVNGLHHMKTDPIHIVNRANSDLPLRLTNNCEEELYPAILTQHGIGPAISGFRLVSGNSTQVTVSWDWRGRVWGRTNCTFNEDGSVPASGQGGRACTTGDCGHFIECQGAGEPPATLAEINLASSLNQAYYDISLVDGYNVPMGIISLAGLSSDPNLTDIPPNLTNPVCIGTSSLLAPIGDRSDETFGSNSTYPIPLEQTITRETVQGWCPFPLLLLPPQKPGDGIYPYPDDKIQRPFFQPCLSACARWNKPEYCCTGDHDTADKCHPSYYSRQAKKICPDAYAFAFDDQTSTFVLPQGGGFEVVFCPAGRSSNILAVFGDQLRELAATGHVTKQIRDLASNVTWIEEKNIAASLLGPGSTLIALLVAFVWLFSIDLWQ